jgi:hypothetical protein
VAVARGQIKLHRSVVARFDHAAFMELLAPVVKPEEVDLVVAGHAAAIWRKHQRGVAHALGVGGAQGQGAAHNPQPQFARGAGQKLWMGPSPKLSW